MGQNFGTFPLRKEPNSYFNTEKKDEFNHQMTTFNTYGPFNKLDINYEKFTQEKKNLDLKKKPEYYMESDF